METRPEWSSRVAKQVGTRVAMYRHRQTVETTADGPRLTEPLTLQQLSDRCTGLGYPIARSVISKLEQGDRRSVTVGEVLVLALALGVAPALLLFPLGQDPLVEVAPGYFTDTMGAIGWFGGDVEMARHDGEVMTVEGVLIPQRPAPDGDLALYRAHSAAVGGLLQARQMQAVDQARLAELESEPSQPRLPGEETAVRTTQDRLSVTKAQVMALEETIRMTRHRLSERGLLLPPLPSWLADLKEEPDGAR